MLGVLKAIAEGMGVNRAAIEYVVRTTLKDQILGRVQHGCMYILKIPLPNIRKRVGTS